MICTLLTGLSSKEGTYQKGLDAFLIYNIVDFIYEGVISMEESGIKNCGDFIGL